MVFSLNFKCLCIGYVRSNSCNMSALSKIRNFLYRNRNKFLVGGVILSASFFIAKYAQQKLREWQEKETKELLERTRKQQHFESTERTCNKTILTLTGTLNECLSKTIDTASIVAELRTNPANKVELWDKMKVAFKHFRAVDLMVECLIGVGVHQSQLINLFTSHDCTNFANSVKYNWRIFVQRFVLGRRRCAAKVLVLVPKLIK